jgi:hypothetical protein
MTPLEQKYSCERSEWEICTLMNKSKKKVCYSYMPSFTDEASDSDGDAKKVRTTEDPKHFIRLKVTSRQWMQLYHIYEQELVYRLSTLLIPNINSW